MGSLYDTDTWWQGNPAQFSELSGENPTKQMRMAALPQTKQHMLMTEQAPRPGRVSRKKYSTWMTRFSMLQ
jgi:hypothetical protein